MSVESTLSIIKPDAVEGGNANQITKMILEIGLKIIEPQEIKLTSEQAAEFYIEHKDRPFYQDLISYMANKPIVVQILEGEDAIAIYRKLMGATNPEEAEEGTIRKLYGKNIEENAVHGSDSVKSAEREINFFYN